MGKDKLKLLYRLMKELSVLYVNNENDMSGDMIDYLDELFDITHYAKKSSNGLKLFKNNKIDIVITGIEVDGVTVFKMIEEIYKINKDIPIFIITSQNNQEYYEKANNYGIKAYLIKPFSLNKLVSTFLDTAEQLDIKKKKLENQKYLEEVNTHLIEIGQKIAKQVDHNIVLETILKGAIELSKADGGTLYLYNKNNDALDFKIAINQSLNINHNEHNKDDEFSFKSLRMHNSDKTINKKNISVICAYEKKLLNLDNIYNQNDLNFIGVKDFDKKHKYKTLSMLVIPLISAEGDLFGVIQLINKLENKKVISFNNNDQLLLTSLSAITTMTIYNNLLLQSQKEKLIKDFL
jgi:YesN/AraC family two-component response regulator